MEILNDIFGGWKNVLCDYEPFRTLLLEEVVPALKFLLKGLHDEFILAGKAVTQTPGLQASRCVRLTRCLLLHYLHGKLLPEADALLKLLVQLLVPEAGLESRMSITVDEYGRLKSEGVFAGVQQIQGLAAGLVVGAGGLASSVAGSLMSRLGGGTSSNRMPVVSQASIPRSYPNNVAFLMLTFDNSSSSSIMIHPSHTTGLCLEALLAYFLQGTLIDRITETSYGEKMYASLLSSLLSALCNLIENGIASEISAKDFDATVRGSQLVTYLEGLLSGAESDIDDVVSTMHDMVMASACVLPSEVFVLAFYLLQVIIRVMLMLSFLAAGETRDKLFLGDACNEAFKLSVTTEGLRTIRGIVSLVCDRSVDNIQNACSSLLQMVEDVSILRRSIGVMTEVVLCCGLLGLHRSVGLAMSKLCKYTLPTWHGLDIYQHTTSSSATLRWAHLQAFARVSQTTHVLADAFVDWDIAMDGFNQMFVFITSAASQVHEEVALTEVDKVSRAIERFKSFSVYLSDESLVKLVASLVGLSMNDLAILASGFTPTGIGGKLSIEVPTYQHVESSVSLSFPLNAIIEIAKLNQFRVAIIWQMVVSHLKLVASLKVISARKFAVTSLFDILTATLLYLKSPNLPVVAASTDVDVDHPTSRISHLLTDDLLFNWVLPPFETCFCGRATISQVLLSKMMSPDFSNNLLSQVELLSSLKTLAAVGFEDVNIQVIQGLLNVLQDGELISGGGWGVVVDILSAVAGSMVIGVSADSSELIGELGCQYNWPKGVLSTAFSCMKLVVDDFLDSVPLTAIENIIVCLSKFSMQSEDVNISLTSVEMLWKVVDHILTLNAPDAESFNIVSSNILDTMMTQLLVLSVDNRPEIRNCAMNTLFSAVVGNSNLLSSGQWRRFFEEILFPLFNKAEDRSGMAMRSNEEANAPELKKGVKMTVHHSRDTAHKQWSESRVLALKGLIRVVRTCSKQLLLEPWFEAVWTRALETCTHAVQSYSMDREVSLAGIDAIFETAKSVSTRIYKGKNALKATQGTASTDDLKSLKTSTTISDSKREVCWRASLSSISAISNHTFSGFEVSLHMLSNLRDLYAVSSSPEFQSDEAFRLLVRMIVSLSRPRLLLDDLSIYCARSPKVTSPVEEVQFNRTVLLFIRDLLPNSASTFACLISSILEMSLSSQFAQSVLSSSVILAPVDLKLRSDLFSYLQDILKSMSESTLNGKKSFMVGKTSISEDPSEFNFPSNFSSIFIHNLTDIIFELNFKDIIACRRASLTNSFIPDAIVTSAIHGIEEDLKMIRSESEKSTASKLVSWAFGNFLSNESSTDTSTASTNTDFVQKYSIVGKPLLRINSIDCSISWSFSSFAEEDLRYLHSALQLCTSQSEKLSFNQWEQVLVVFSCALSPWRKSELLVCDRGFCDINTFTATLYMVTDFLVRITLEGDFHETFSYSLISCLENAADLLSLAALETISDSNSYFLSSIETILIHLVAIFKTSRNLSINRRALTSLVHIVHLTINLTISKATAGGLEEKLCIFALKEILSLQSSWIPSNTTLEYSIVRERVVNRWLSVVSDFNSQISVIEGVSNSHFTSNGHLVVLFSSVVRLLSSDAPLLRQLGADFIRVVEISNIVEGYIRQQQELVKLSSENEDLRSELVRYKAAAQLPF